ncbi:hypothetical protein IKG41_01030 [Candidatus Saccharibacteria bacterium]|nr:hypothetical protein [Candidatus Saccharibacteria bacterium]
MKNPNAFPGSDFGFDFSSESEDEQAKRQDEEAYGAMRNLEARISQRRILKAEAEEKARMEAEAEGKSELEDGAKVEPETIVAEKPEPTPANSPESSPSKEQIEETKQKAKKSSKFKRAIMTAILVGGTAAAAIAAIFTGKGGGNTGNQNVVEDVVDDTESISNPESEARGIRDGYNETGMFASTEKSGPYDFASAVEVAEVCNDDEVEMIKYTAGNQVESFADYLANLPEQLQPEGFRGLSILETEQRLESLSPEEYDNVLEQFNDTMDRAFTRRTNLNGNYDNAFMRELDANGGLVHGNVESVACTTNEQGITVNEFFWLDQEGNEYGSMIVKIIYGEDGEITGGCLQVVNPEGSRPDIYEGLPDITPDAPSTPSTPETPVVPPVTPPETPPETIAPKDEENMTRIDNNVLGDIAEDVGTGEVTVSQTPTSEVESQAPTSAPAPEAYEGTSATTVPNAASTQAETVAPTSPANDYSQNRGGANADEYAPVQANEAAQQAADQAEIPVEQAPTGGQALDDILGDLGIN